MFGISGRRGGGSLGSIVGVSGARARVILVLRECMCDAMMKDEIGEGGE